MKRNVLYVLTLGVLFTACLQKNKSKLNIIFDNVERLEIGSPVNLRGIKIGEVVALDLLKNGVLVEIEIKREIQIPVNSKFSITNNPLVGIVSISIEPSKEKIFLKRDDTAKGNYINKGLLDTFFEDSLNRKKAREAIDKIATGLKELAESKKDSSNNK